MGTEQHGDPGQRDELATLADMADSVDADRAYQQAAADVGLRREAHVSPSLANGCHPSSMMPPATCYSEGYEPGRGCRRGRPSPGSRGWDLLAFRSARASVPSTKAWARSDRRRLLVLA